MAAGMRDGRVEVAEGMTIQGPGRLAAWRYYAAFTPEQAQELEGLGYGTLWLGGSPPADLPVVESLLEATETQVVGTSIVNIWSTRAEEVAESYHRIQERFPDRFMLGVGVGHPEHTSGYQKPYDALVEYLDALDAAGVPKDNRALAALGPRVLKLARDRTAGALPYLAPPEHTRRARRTLGSDTLLAAENKVVLDTDPERARATGRDVVKHYLNLENYLANLRRLGYDGQDVAAPGSDRLIDALALHGTADEIVDGLVAHLTAGADQIVVQPLGDDYVGTLRTLAPLLAARI